MHNSVCSLKKKSSGGKTKSKMSTFDLIFISFNLLLTQR